MAFINHNRSRTAHFPTLDLALVIRHADGKISARLEPSFGPGSVINLHCLLLLLTCVLPQLLDVNLAGSEGCVWLNNSTSPVV